ncbi:uncharacterized protein LOC118791603 [Megalops cyprinoides]|uniref:uncharacterized protein LOC118791603 n=1 Tax=Megalops cyprinoides TaxID=118141 RepID=UPI001864BAEE|nr:uncharacterized protein LOC118791603 [Megalops cyprinoides]
MSALIGLVLVLAAVSYGSSSSCNATGNKTLTQCYGAVGQPLFIYLITNPSGYTLILKNNITGTVFTHRNNISRFYGTFANHSIFYPNGTVQLTKAEKMHSGKYLFEIYRGSAGQFLQARTVDLFIKVPVSAPTLSQLCLPHGETRVSCSAEGDNPQYSWTLGNRPLHAGVAYLSNDSHTVILKKSVSGALTCTACNLISSQNITQELITCPGLGAPVICVLPNKTEIQVRMNASLDAISLLSNTEIFFSLGENEISSAICHIQPHSPQGGVNGNFTLLAVAVGAIILLMALSLAIYCLYKKKNSPTEPDGRIDDTQELVYAQVTVAKKRSQIGRKKEAEPEVVYGQVKV